MKLTMKTKTLSFILVFTTLMFASGILDCGCVMAQVVEKSNTYCAQEQSQKSNAHGDCCGGCQIETQARTPKSVGISIPSRDVLFTLTTFKDFTAHDLFANDRKSNHLSFARLSLQNSASYPFSLTQPLYLTLEVLRI